MPDTLESHLPHAATPLEAEIQAMGPWFHNLHLPDGTQTAPNHPFGDFPAFKWQQIAPSLPEDLSGWTALDIGCNAGFYTFELARRGARVTGIDVDERYLRQANWAARQFGLTNQVQFEAMQVYDLARSTRSFDLVLFMGVLYHLRYPLLALDVLTHRVGRLMVFQTLTMPGEEVLTDIENCSILERDRMLEAGWPKMAFVEHRFAGDLTNWWVPNHAAVEAMLRSSGFSVKARPGHEIYVCEPSAQEPYLRDHVLTPQYRAATGAPPEPQAGTGTAVSNSRNR